MAAEGPKKQTQNKPNSKPVLSAVEWANLRKAKMNVNSLITKDYRKKDDFAVTLMHKDRARHTICAAVVAAVGYRDSQVVYFSIKSV